MTDNSQRFIFEDTDIRGELVTLEASYQEILQQHYYPQTIVNLLGEFFAASVLLASTIKFKGRLVLQARSQGDIPLMMVECTHEQVIRGWSKFSEETVSEDFKEQFAEGVLVITIEPLVGKNYQGMVPMESDSLTGCLESYFMQSEQLATKLVLEADGKRAAGLLLQQLPLAEAVDEDEREEHWQHVLQLVNTIKPEEQLELSHNDLLYRLYHQDKVRLFEERAVEHRCSCSRERTANALLTLGLAEVMQIIEEDDKVEMNCEFCNQTYEFNESDVKKLFEEQGKA